MKLLHRASRTSSLSPQVHSRIEAAFPLAAFPLQSVASESPRHRTAARSLWACGRIRNRLSLVKSADAACDSRQALKRSIKARSGAKNARHVLFASLLMLLIVELPSRAAETSTSASTSNDAAKGEAVQGARLNLPLGRVRRLQLPQDASFRVVEGAEIVAVTVSRGALEVTPKRVGRAVITVEAPDRAPQNYLVRVVLAAADAPTTKVGEPEKVGVSVKVAEQNGTTLTTAISGSTSPAPGTNAAGAPRVPAVALPTDSGQLPTTPAVPVAPVVVPQTFSTGSTTASGTTTAGTPTADVPSSFVVPAPSRSTGAPPLPTLGPGPSPFSASPDGGQISPVLPGPARGLAGAPYPTRGRLPAGIQRLSAADTRNAVFITQGLARFFRFSRNILTVFYSDVNVMAAKPINARNVAITGLAPGISTLAVFTERFSGDAVGQAHVYKIAVNPSVSSGGRPVAISASDAGSMEEAIRAAVSDPRVSVSVFPLPNGSLAARLSGVLRDVAEIEAARATAALFVPSVVSSLYADKAAPLREAALRPGQTPESLSETQLRQLTDNESIRILPLPNGTLALKAYVDSTAEAEALLNLLPSLGRPVTPFIVIRGGAGVEQSVLTQPILNEEDADMTRRMQAVTRINTVYAIRTAQNGLAVYGTVRTRAAYDRVRRYASVLPQVRNEKPEKDNNPSNAPASGNQFPFGVQLFVRILDSSQNVIRRVTVHSNVVEINRTSLRNLGLELGSVSVLTQTVTPGSAGTEVTSPTGVRTTTGATSPSVTRTINPNPNIGSFLGGNGVVGLEGFQNIDPFRVRLNALYQRGNARVLSQPNLTATDGAVAQVLIGGNRPVPQGGVTNGAAVQSVVFRRFGIILTMRPTFTDDDTIILQIRADITNVDPTFSINLGGSIVPGESTRSVDNTLTVRDGDIIVMAGLITNERRQITSKIPILSQIPFFGKLFQSKRFENNETELAIFLTPRISRTPASEETLADIQRIPALPPLPDAQPGSGLLILGGAAR